MELKDIKEIIRLIDSSSITEFQLDGRDFKVFLKKGSDTGVIRNIENKEKANNSIQEDIINEPEGTRADENIHVIVSPILGTFYKSPGPDSPPYVKVGDRIKKGDVLCIVEAMKLMNEITSEVDGEVVEILVENQSLLEYGQPLFRIRTV